MDKFYRQNPPQEDLTLQNILQETSDDYLKLNRENQTLKQKVQDLNSTLEFFLFQSTKQVNSLTLAGKYSQPLSISVLAILR